MKLKGKFPWWLVSVGVGVVAWFKRPAAAHNGHGAAGSGSGGGSSSGTGGSNLVGNGSGLDIGDYMPEIINDIDPVIEDTAPAPENPTATPVADLAFEDRIRLAADKLWELDALWGSIPPRQWHTLRREVLDAHAVTDDILAGHVNAGLLASLPPRRPPIIIRKATWGNHTLIDVTEFVTQLVADGWHTIGAPKFKQEFGTIDHVQDDWLNIWWYDQDMQYRWAAAAHFIPGAEEITLY